MHWRDVNHWNECNTKFQNYSDWKRGLKLELDHNEKNFQFAELHMNVVSISFYYCIRNQIQLTQHGFSQKFLRKNIVIGPAYCGESC